MAVVSMIATIFDMVSVAVRASLTRAFSPPASPASGPGALPQASDNAGLQPATDAKSINDNANLRATTGVLKARVPLARGNAPGDRRRTGCGLKVRAKHLRPHTAPPATFSRALSGSFARNALIPTKPLIVLDAVLAQGLGNEGEYKLRLQPPVLAAHAPGDATQAEINRACSARNEGPS